MIATLALIFGLVTLGFTVLLSLLNAFDFITLGVLVIGFNLVQWLISPYIIDAMYRTKEIREAENPMLHQTVRELSRKSGINKPKLMLAQIPLPNAFAYGSPLTGNRVAVTEGMLKTLDSGQVEAVIGHELGHLKHRDVQIMMIASILPALFYYIGYSFMLSSLYGRQRNEGGGAIIGIVMMALYWILTLFTLNLSRTREYYADRHSVSMVENGAQKLSTGLAKIVYSTKNMSRNKKQTKNLTAMKALFIADPDRAEIDHANLAMNDQKLVEDVLSRKLTTADRILEVLSTHPNIVKRLRALQTAD